MQAWIKVSVAMNRSRKTVRLARLLKIPERLTSDLLIRFFRWARDGAAETGDVGNWRAIDIMESIHAEDYFKLDDGGAEKAWKFFEDAGWVFHGWIEDWHQWGGAHVWERARKNPKKFGAMVYHYSKRDEDNGFKLEAQEEKGAKYRPAKTAQLYLAMYRKEIGEECPWTSYYAAVWKDIVEAHTQDGQLDQQGLTETVKAFYAADWAKKINYALPGLRKGLAGIFKGGNGGKQSGQKNSGLAVNGDGLGL